MKKIITIILSLILVLSIGITAYGATITYKDKDGNTQKFSDFKDTKGHWAHDAILRAADYGWVAGDNGNFMPNKPITRGDLCVILDRFLGLKNTTYNVYEDLPNDEYYTEAVLKCVAAGYVSGTSAYTVDPRGNATREQVATILTRMLSLKYSSSDSVVKYNDDYHIGYWAKDSVYAMRKYGYMNGTENNCFNPKANITRAEMVQVLSNLARFYFNENESSYVGTFADNAVVAKNGTVFNNSYFGKNVITTFNVRGIDINNSTIENTLFIMTACTCNVNKSNIDEIYLNSGKSEITGIGKGIKSVYVAYDASESTLNAIPEKLILEPYTRVSIAGKMYENTYYKNKEYVGKELLADLASEQNYVIGGSKIVSCEFSQSYDNTITVKNVMVSKGESEIVEYGVLWLKEKENYDLSVPNYKNCTRKVQYKPTRTDENISFDVCTNQGYNAYRFYVKDSNGLFGYSKVFTFKAYDFNAKINIYNEEYPKTLNCEVIFTGSNIPKISSVELIYALDETYKDNVKRISLTQYSSRNIGEEINKEEYLRYYNTLNNYRYVDEDGAVNYDLYTCFGYYITFANGEKLYSFPVLTQVVPEGTPPISFLSIGQISFEGNRVILKGNSVKTRYIPAKEVGIAYIESNNDNITTPSNNLSEWSFVKGGDTVDAGMTYKFNSSIYVNENYKYTYMIPYINTANGYYYGDISKIENDWKADDDGPVITGNPTITVLNGNTVLVEIPYDSQNGISLYSEFIKTAYINGENSNTFSRQTLYDCDCAYSESGNKIVFCLSNLKEKSAYSIMMRLYDNNGRKSKMIPIEFNTNNAVTINITNKGLAYGWITYSVSCPGLSSWRIQEVSWVGENLGDFFIESGKNEFNYRPSKSSNEKKVILRLSYNTTIDKDTSKTYVFYREVQLY